MPVLTRIQTNATYEEIEKAVSCFNNNVTFEKENQFTVYMDSFDRYTLLPENANDILEEGLREEKKDLEFKILSTELE